MRCTGIRYEPILLIPQTVVRSVNQITLLIRDNNTTHRKLRLWTAEAKTKVPQFRDFDARLDSEGTDGRVRAGWSSVPKLILYTRTLHLDGTRIDIS